MHFRQLFIELFVGFRIAKRILPFQNLVVAQILYFKQRIHRIQSKARNAALVPEPRGVVHRLLHFRIPPIQIRLLRIKIVIIKLAGARIELPRRPAKRRNPVIRRRSIGLAIAPDVPVALRICFRRTRLHEPRMLIRTVVHHKIENNPHAFLLALRHHGIEVLQRPIHRIDILVIRYVIPEIHLWRREAGRNPNRVHAQVVQVPHFRFDTLEISNAVVVAVSKAARIELVKHRTLPPFVSRRSGLLGRR